MQDTVLIVEDEPDVVDLLRYNLGRAGFDILIAVSGDRGLEMARTQRPDIIILDLMLPGMTGQEVCRALKNDPDTEVIPIVMLTAKGEPEERVKGLELGADDYVTKPFSPRELVLRVQALLKRHRVVPRSETVQLAGIYLDKTNFEARLDGKRIDLTTTEFDLLLHFMRHPGRPFTRNELLDVSLDDTLGDASAYERTIDVHVKNIRRKLGDGGRNSRFIETVHGVGYRFVPQAEERPAR